MRLFFIVLLFICYSMSAQEYPIGIKIGGNIPTLVGDATQDVSSSFNFQAGFYTEIFTDEKVALQADLLYSGHGFKLDIDEDTSNIVLNYLILAVVSKIFLSDRLSLDAGPQVGLLLSARESTDNLESVKRDFYNRDFGVNMGTSYEISKKVTASFRYYLGLTDVTLLNTKNFNRALQLALQFKIN